MNMLKNGPWARCNHHPCRPTRSHCPACSLTMKMEEFKHMVCWTAWSSDTQTHMPSFPESVSLLIKNCGVGNPEARLAFYNVRHASSKTSMDLLSLRCWIQGKWQTGGQSNHHKHVSDLKCWAIWDTAYMHAQYQRHHAIHWSPEGERCIKRQNSTNLPWKDKKRLLSIRQHENCFKDNTGKFLRDELKDNISMGVTRQRYHLELTELKWNGAQWKDHKEAIKLFVFFCFCVCVLCFKAMQMSWCQRGLYFDRMYYIQLLDN